MRDKLESANGQPHCGEHSYAPSVGFDFSAIHVCHHREPEEHNAFQASGCGLSSERVRIRGHTHVSWILWNGPAQADLAANHDGAGYGRSSQGNKEAESEI